LVRAAAVRSTLCTVDEEAPTREVGDARSKGVWTITAGNAGHGVAFAARGFGVPCTVVAIDTAPETKVERMKKRGARIVKTPFARGFCNTTVPARVRPRPRMP